MHDVKRALALVLIAALPIISASASYRLVLQAGHEGTPVAVEWHDRSRSLVSVGEDGRLIVTDPDEGRVLHRFRVASDRISDVRVNPARDHAAVVSTDGSSYRVAVWDWNEEREIFDYDLDSEPLFVTWSARGRYLVVGNLGDPSVLVLEGRTGRRLSYLQRLPSLYNAGYVGSTETILMTYATSGSIRYWDIRSSALKLSAETVGNLQGVTVLQIGTKSLIFAYRGETLYLINRQTGAVADQVDIADLVDVSVDPESGEIDALALSPSGSFLVRYGIRSERFIPRDFGVDDLSSTATPQKLPAGLNPTGVLRRDGSTYLSTSSGRLMAEGLAGFSSVVDDRIWRPDDVDFGGNSVYLSGASSILRFTSPFFREDSRGRSEDLNDLTRDKTDTGSSSEETGIHTLSDGRILNWDVDYAGEQSGYRVSFFGRTTGIRNRVLGSGITNLDLIDGGRMLTVDRSGTVSIVGISDAEVETEYTALGILDAAYAPSSRTILAGRSSSGRSGSPLEQVDVDTGESIPVPDDRFMVYEIIADDDAFYTIGAERRSSGESRTALVRHDLDDPSRTRVLLEVEGEDLDAVVRADPTGSGIFTTLGGVTRRIDGNRRTTFSWNEPITELVVRGSVLYGLDGDGALVMWNINTGQAFMKVHFFDDGGWIAMPPDGDRIWASPGAIENVVLYRNGRQVDPRRVSRVVNDGTQLLM